MTSYLPSTKTLFLWQQKPETLDDLDAVLSEPPPAPGAPVGVSYPEFQDDSDVLPLSSNSRCPFLDEERPRAGVHQQLAGQDTPPAEQASQPAATDAGPAAWLPGASLLQQLPGPRLLLRRQSGSGQAAAAAEGPATAAVDGAPAAPGASSPPCGSPQTVQQTDAAAGTVLGAAIGAPAAHGPSAWLHHLPGSSLLLGKAPPATAPSSTGSASPASNPRTQAATAEAVGWGSYLPSLHWSPQSRGQDSRAAAQAPEGHELTALVGAGPGKAEGEGLGSPKAAVQQGEHAHAPGHLAAALQRTWHEVGSVTTAYAAPVAVSIVGAAVGGVIAGPLGVAMGAKSGAAFVAAGALSGAAAHYATHMHPKPHLGMGPSKGMVEKRGEGASEAEAAPESPAAEGAESGPKEGKGEEHREGMDGGSTGDLSTAQAAVAAPSGG